VSYVREGLSWPVSEYAASLFATEVGTDAEAIAAVEERANHGAKHIKVAIAQVPLDGAVFTRPLLETIVKAAHARGLKVVAHIDSADNALLAARSGVDALMHGVQLGELTVEQAQELKSLGTVVAPTLDVWDRIDRIAQFAWQPTPIELLIEPPESLRPYSPEVTRVEAGRLAPKLLAWVQALQASSPHRNEAVKRMFEAGVPIFAGSDASGSIACIPGGAFLDELRLLNEAGLPNADVLLAATSRPARFIDPNADYGTLEVGKRADLVLVEGNPLEDIAATSRIVAVVQGGTVLDRLR
jgi:imidazolonepropionase-like amidohydrolase